MFACKNKPYTTCQRRWHHCDVTQNNRWNCVNGCKGRMQASV